MDPGAGGFKPGTASKPGRETPTATLRQASWDRQLDAYARPAGGSPSAHRTLRLRLAEAVKASPESPEAWWALLQQEEAWAAAAGGTAGLERGAATRGGISLLDLFAAATKNIPRQNNYTNDSFVKIWLGFARQQWARHPDDARDVLKMLKSQHIGDQQAALYYEWAALEAGSGNRTKALGVLAKGLKENAQPACLLEQMQSDLQAGRFVYRAPWAQDSGAKTGHTAASSLAAFLTPGVLDVRRSSATHTLDGSVGCPATAATDTLPINRPGARRHSNLQPRAADPGAKAACDADVTAGAVAAPAAAQQQQQQDLTQQGPGLGQHTAGLTDQLNGNRTSHTIHSGSTVGSDDPTATMPMKTPATNLSNRTGSSSGSLGEEATVSLRKSGLGGNRASGEGVGAAAGTDRQQRGFGDDTLVINRSSRLALASSAAVCKDGGGGGAAPASAAKDQGQPGLMKPRRLGVLGKAQRVMPGSVGRPPLVPAVGAASAGAAGAAAGEQPPPPTLPQQRQSDLAAAAAVDAEAAAAADASRKRKAEVDACQSPRPLLSVGDGKRRQLPADEAKASRPGFIADPPAAARPPERQLPPVPRFDARPAAPAVASSAGRTVVVEIVSTAAPARMLPAGTQAPVPAPATLQPQPAPSPPGRQQAVVQAGGVPGGHRGAEAVGRGEEEETAPVVMTKLAQRVQRGRQSLAPSKIVLSSDGSLLSGGAADGGTPGLGEDDDAPTMPVSRPASSAAAPSAAAATAAGDEDADATRPLLRASVPSSSRACSPPPARSAGPRVQIDGAGNVNVLRSTAAGHKPLPVPPPPPPALKEASGQQHRVPMGPPPPKQQPQRAPAAAAAPSARPGRRVVEDENSVTVKDISYTKLECVGRGGSSKVYKVMAPNRKIFALKRIRLQGRDAEAASGFLDEIRLLNSLAGRSNIIQLIDSEVHRSEGLIYVVLEFGDIDLARLLQKHEKTRREREQEVGGGQAEEIDENFIRLYWEQMLQAVDTIHRERIVHSDLKPANFLVVEGQLKLIDFGIAKAIQSDTTSIARESQVGTLNYMSPEAILGGQNNIRGGPPMKVGRPSDIWSLGCILYQMVYGQTPFSHLPFIQKMHAIIDPGHRVSFPPLRNAALLDVIQRCLDRNPRSRISMQELLEHPFLRPCQAPPAPPAAGTRPGSVELSREQLTKLLQQVAATGMPLAGSEVGLLSDQLFKQLSSGLSPDLVSRRLAARASQQPQAAALPQQQHQQQAAPVAPKAPPAVAPARQLPAAAQPAAVQQQQRSQPSVADAAAAAAAARAGQQAAAVLAIEARPRVTLACGSGRSALMDISQAATAQQAASLPRVEASECQPAAGQPESGLEAALRKGLERFKFEDATSGEDGGNTTAGSSDR